MGMDYRDYRNRQEPFKRNKPNKSSKMQRVLADTGYARLEQGWGAKMLRKAFFSGIIAIEHVYGLGQSMRAG